jgi:TIGR03009 family protein
MRGCALGFSVMLLFGTRLPAQEELDRHLAGWERAMKETKSLGLHFEVVRETAVFKKQEKSTGQAALLQPNRIRCSIQDKNGELSAYICNQKSIFLYNFAAKTVSELPTAGANLPKRMFDLVVGMTAADSRKRYQISLLKSDSDRFVRFNLRPIADADKKQFEFIRLSLNSPSVKEPLVPYRTAEIVLQKMDGDVETWTFSKQQVNLPQIEPKLFEFESPSGRGWTIHRMQSER